ncbi:hypothetical protein [Streptomyces fuscichromogenes]|uniref:Uncharacterized protein n=1 Tax=Streptomyces fuscichromogenes TaxID=1324013 RepID=A0A917X9G5_9ACTN|nr:hypothetical protein [Streptomyces fuscichromogenes]GGM97240.1 hypothetical protein GCM10011578_017450 [Streptomyces fuscichromogenes]
MSGYAARLPAGDRPLLMLGISGVIALEDPVVPARTVRLTAWGRWAREVAVPEVAADRVAELAGLFQIVWVSEWGHVAHEAFREVLRLPEAPWPFLPAQFDKLPVIRDYAGRRPWAWVDEPVADLAGPVPRSDGGVVVRVGAGAGISEVDPADLARRVLALR